MSRIFISYSRRDREMVDSIVEKIEAAGIGIWIDREDIKAGKTWRVQIVEAIATCDAFVLMLSSNSARLRTTSAGKLILLRMPDAPSSS